MLSVFLKRVFAVKPLVMFVYKPQFVLGFVLLRVATDLNNDTVFFLKAYFSLCTG